MFVIVQQTESNILMLLVARTSGIAPVVGLFAIVAAPRESLGLLFLDVSSLSLVA